MALRTIEYEVDYSGITPSARQDGGVQGDHGVTELKFKLKESLFSRLGQSGNLADGKLYYRFNLYNGEGSCKSTEAQQLKTDGAQQLKTDSVLVLPLEEWITRYGGIIKVVLVISLEVEEDGDRATYTELYTVPAILTLKRRPTGSEPGGKQYKSMALMSIQTMEAAEQAAEDAKKAEQAAEIAEQAAEGAESCAQRAQDSIDALDGAEIIFKSELDEEGIGVPFGFAFEENSSKPLRMKARMAYINKPREYWETQNPILEDGEMGFVSDVNDNEWCKIGNGVTAWNDLPWKKGPKGDDFVFEDFTDEQLESLTEKVAEISTEDVERELEKNTEFVFYGGDASGVPSTILSTEQIAEGLKRLEQIDSSVTSHENRINTNEFYIETLKNQDSMILNRIVEVEGQTNELIGENFDLLNVHEVRITAAETKISELETNIGALAPPNILVDTEIETNEKCDDKTVYIMRKEISSLADANNNTQVNIGKEIETLVDVTIIIRSSTSDGGTYSRYKLPAFDVKTGDLMATFRLNSLQALNIYSFVDLRKYSAEIFVKYTKA